MIRLAALLFVLACTPKVAPAPLLAEAETAPGRELAGFVAFVQTVHPDPYRSTSRDRFELVARAAIAALDADAQPSPTDVERAWRSVLAELHDAHAGIGFDPAVLDPQDFSVLPLGLRLTADGAVVDRTLEDWPVGTVVTHIDGVSMDEIVARLVPRTFSDGVGEEPRRARISAEFSRNYHAEFGLRPSYAIRALAPDGTVIEAELQGLTPIALRERRPPSRIGSILGDSPEPWPRLHALPDGTPVVRMPSFGVPDQEAYAARVDAIFDQIGRPDALVLDLRGNPGGLRTHGMAVLDHLTPGPYAQWSRSRARVGEIPAEWADNVVFLYGSSEEALARYVPPRRQGWLEGDPLVSRADPVSEPLLDTKLVVVVDGITGSAANELVLALKAVRPDAVLVGEEVGGGCERHVGEVPIAYRAGKTGVVAMLSLVEIEHVQVEDCEPGRGLIPEERVTWTRDAMVAGTDPFLERAAAVVERLTGR